MKNATKSAMIVIDMENGFINSQSAHCISMAQDSIPFCVNAIKIARQKEIPIFFVKRIYRFDGSDIEMTRYNAWESGGYAMTPGSTGLISAQAPIGLKPQNGDYTIIKSRWSAFLGTPLDLMLRRLGIETVILIGTTTPNCIRTTCYDANSLDYDVVILEDCCSSQTAEIQKVNIEDMKRMGAIILNSESFKDYTIDSVPHNNKNILKNIEINSLYPENFEETENGVAQVNIW